MEDIGVDEPYFLARSRINNYYPGGIGKSLYCFGDGETEELATLRCLGETIERTCLTTYQDKEFIRASFSALSQQSVPAHFLKVYSEDQYCQPNFLFSAFSVEASYDWVPTQNAFSGKKTLLPADYLFAGYRGKGKTLYQASSIGAAVHPDKDQAISSAVLEIVERDALALSFLRKYKLARLNVDNFPSLLSTLNILKREGFDVYLLDAALDIDVPTVLILAFSQKRAPFFLKGAAAAYSIGAAAEKALREVWRSFLFYRKWPSKLLHSHQAATCQGPEYNLAYYQDKSARKQLQFLLGEATQHSWTTPIANQADLIDRIRRVGLEVLFTQQAPRLVSQLGLSYVKAFIPGAVPVSFGTQPWCLGLKRVYRNHGMHRRQGRRLNLKPHYFS